MRIKFILGVKNISCAVVTLQFALDENKSSVSILLDERWPSIMERHLIFHSRADYNMNIYPELRLGHVVERPEVTGKLIPRGGLELPAFVALEDAGVKSVL